MLAQTHPPTEKRTHAHSLTNTSTHTHIHAQVKTAPERWQDHDRSQPMHVVLTYEERVFDAVLQDLQVFFVCDVCV